MENIDDKYSELIEICRIKLSSGSSNEDVLLFLRKSGVTKVTSIGIVSRVLKIDAQNAKKLVHDSAAWADLKETHEEFQRNINKLM